MECKFIKHGIALSYDQVVKPCCQWDSGQSWKKIHHISKVDPSNWHNHHDVTARQNQLVNGSWPTECKRCERAESQGRDDSGRGNGNSAYKHYQPTDITLEIRPGNVCNFACQTCWPDASSRVAQYHSRAGLIDIKNLDSRSIDNFDFLLPISKRIKDVVLLGGEPFYDKSCRKFLVWAQEHLDANLIMFTNGSDIDFEFLKSYKGKITLVFSLDAVGKAAEYIRFGTVWDDVISNYYQAKKLVSVRVNITCSVYNYYHLESLIELLTPDWPSVVSFGTPYTEYLLESTIPVEVRKDIIASLHRAIALVRNASIESGQQHNAVNALQNIICNLETKGWDRDLHQQWCQFVRSMDQVKQMHAHEYCDVLDKILNYVD